MKKIIVAFSGGIDSSICSFILKKLNYKLICCYLENNIKNDLNKCTSEEDIYYCYRICKIFKIKIKILNSNNYFYKKIFIKLIKEYEKGFSYNPDIYCNYLIKFNYLIKNLKNKFYKYAFGHYAINNKNLLCAYDKKKDQTYFIYKIIKNKNFNKYLFPIGKWKKIFIRYLAIYLILPNVERKSSKGICFIFNKKFCSFIGKFIKSKGKIFVNDIEYYKKYKNLYYSSLGQRIKMKINNDKHFIYKKKNKNIYLTKKKNTLLYKRIYLINECFILKKNNFYKCKLNSRNKFNFCFILFYKKYYKVVLLYPLRIISIGQHIVFYKKNICLGGGKIFK
ncbi:aminomethyltransferase beta-barrel domain-containing protein [Candidatus Vidania fulgoroideorum]